MFNVRLAGGHLYGKQLFTWLSLVVSLMASFVLSFFPLDVLDEIWDLIESVSEGFLTYSFLLLFRSLFACPKSAIKGISVYSESKIQTFPFFIQQLTQVDIDGWMTCIFTSFWTVFQLYQDDGQMIMNDMIFSLRL